MHDVFFPLDCQQIRKFHFCSSRHRSISYFLVILRFFWVENTFAHPGGVKGHEMTSIRLTVVISYCSVILEFYNSTVGYTFAHFRTEKSNEMVSMLNILFFLVDWWFWYESFSNSLILCLQFQNLSGNFVEIKFFAMLLHLVVPDHAISQRMVTKRLDWSYHDEI